MSCLGSPPLAWGILRGLKMLDFIARITPTCVGNTFVSRRNHYGKQDHPHLRGEYLICYIHNLSFEGSPPLAWGILSDNPTKAHIIRITPTCVGNTPLAPCALSAPQDHPHLRGEYTFTKRCWSIATGSPPLAWGILWINCCW